MRTPEYLQLSSEDCAEVTEGAIKALHLLTMMNIRTMKNESFVPTIDEETFTLPYTCLLYTSIFSTGWEIFP